MGTTRKDQNEAVIPQSDEHKENATKSTKYTLKLECKIYIFRRDKMKQGLKRLLPLLIGQCDNVLKEKLRNLRNFKTIKYGGSILKLIDAIRE